MALKIPGTILAGAPSVDDNTGDQIWTVAVSGGGGGGGGGDASAANQTTEIARLTSIRDATGAATDAAYSTADGSASGTLAALLKGAYVRLSAIATALAGTLTTRRYQNTITANASVTLTTAATQLFGALPARSGARVLNPTSAIVYLLYGTAGTPSSTNYHDLIPAAVSGLPGQWEPPVAPVGGVVAALASGTGNVVTQDF